LTAVMPFAGKPCRLVDAHETDMEESHDENRSSVQIFDRVEARHFSERAACG